MADKSAIEWCDSTWNPIVGCSIVSPGCTHCYAMTMAARIEAMRERSHYAGTTKKVNGNTVWTGKLALAPERILTAPLCWKRPRRIFVNSMGDLFHEDVPDAWIGQVFGVMALCPQHIFQVLTKRSKRMREWFDSRDRAGRCPFNAKRAIDVGRRGWPLPNVWLGVSAEDQVRADERVPDLLATPAAIRFVSAEPLLGPIDFTRVGRNKLGLEGDALRWPGFGGPSRSFGERLNWIIAGGESGPKARPMHPDWPRRIRDQCAAAGVAYFFKQWGEWLPLGANPDQGWWYNETKQNRRTGLATGKFLGSYCHIDSEDQIVRLHGPAETRQVDPRSVPCLKVGKARAGRLLDGVAHDAMPAR